MTTFSPKLTETEIYALVHSKNALSAELLYDLYAKALFLVIIRIVPKREVAEEILQQTFLEAWNTFHFFMPGEEKLLSWMIRIARNLAQRHACCELVPLIA